MRIKLSAEQSALKIKELQSRLDEHEQLIEAIKAGQVDAFALKANNHSEIYTLQTGDYAYRMLVENFREGALNLSDEALIVYTNNYFTELLNLSYENVIGNSFFQFIHPESKDTFNELFKKGLAGQAKGEINLLTNDKIIPVYISLSSMFPILPIVGMIVTDLTEKKKNEEILKKKNVELEKMNNELQSFAYISSHDLQEPLRKIQTFAARIIEKEENNLSENGKYNFNRMWAAAKRMQILIQDLLTYSRINTKERKFENVDLNEILAELKDDFKEDLNDKHAILEVNELCYANIIPFQFRQVMHNLIGNALRFSNPLHPPHIIIKSEIASGIKFDNVKLSPQTTYCHISVSDNGIGFEQKYSERIFEVFQRLHDKTEYKGSGIGLAIVKKIVENHEGIITARSELNKGATFDIYIPAT